MDVNEISSAVVDAAIAVHKELGPGLLESTYEACLGYELGLRRLEVQNQLMLPVAYKSISINNGYRVDLLVEDEVIVELKSVERLLPIREAQLLTYLRLGQKKVGLLINFNCVLLKQGLKRIVN